MLRVSRDSGSASPNARFIRSLAAKSLETVGLVDILVVSPDDPAGQTSLAEHLDEIRESAAELGFVHLEAAVAEALRRLEREAFAAAALVAMRVLAWRYESLAAMPGQSGTHPVVTEDEVAEAPAADSESAAELSLRGRRILVADDEAEVRWFYVGALREASARVIEAGDGALALELAREQVPDAILADIVMPRLDGLALCAAIRREPVLDGVPVVLLSWRDDFLHRMRELRAEAQDYLRKEVPAREIIGRVSRVLAPLGRLEAALKGAREVSGDLEEFGAAGLLRAVSRFRPSASIVLQDPWSLFDLELQEGQIRSVTRTAIDGASSQGAAALPALVGMSSGRFVVAEQAPRDVADDLRSLHSSFVEATRHLGDLLNTLAARPDCLVEFDHAVLGTYVRHSPLRVQQLIGRLVSGEAPEALWESGAGSRSLVDALLVTLARQGAIREVTARDRVAEVGADEASPLVETQALNPPGVEQDSPSVGDSAERENVRAQSTVAMHREPANEASIRMDPIWRLSTGIGEGSSDSGSRFEMEMQTTPRLIGLSFLVLLSATVAFLIWNQMATPTASTGSAAEGRTRSAEPGSVQEPRVTTEAPAAAEPSRPPMELDFSAFSGTLREGVDSSLSVSASQGVLEVTGPSVLRVEVDGVDRGTLPVTVVLVQGMHRVRTDDGLRSTDRFCYVESGSTRALSVVTQGGALVDAL